MTGPSNTEKPAFEPMKPVLDSNSLLSSTLNGTEIPKPKINIRPRRPSDLPALVPILKAVHAKSGYPVEMPSLQTDEQIISAISPEAWQSWVAESIVPGPTTEATGILTQILGHVVVTPFHRNAREADWREKGKCTVENSGHVGRLFVSPEAQGLGAGATLMHAAMQYAADKGKKLCIYVVTKDAKAVQLYERLGWVRIGMETYQGWDNWMYVWHGWDGTVVSGTEYQA